MFKYIPILAISLLSSISFAKQKIVLGVESINYYPIYGTFNEKDIAVGEYVGYASELFRLFDKSQDKFEIEFRPRPVKRLFVEYLTEGALDAKFPDNEMWGSDARKDKKIIYSNPVLNYIDGVFVKSENKGKKKVTEIKSIGTIAGFTPFEYLKYIKPAGSMDVQESDSTNSLLQKVSVGKIDMAYVNVVIGKTKLNKANGTDKLEFDDTLPYTKSSYFLSTMKYPELIKEFNTFMESKKTEINALKKKYEIEG